MANFDCSGKIGASHSHCEAYYSLSLVLKVSETLLSFEYPFHAISHDREKSLSSRFAPCRSSEHSEFHPEVERTE
jgi:hypothetical protein